MRVYGFYYCHLWSKEGESEVKGNESLSACHYYYHFLRSLYVVSIFMIQQAKVKQSDIYTLPTTFTTNTTNHPYARLLRSHFLVSCTLLGTEQTWKFHSIPKYIRHFHSHYLPKKKQRFYVHVSPIYFQCWNTFIGISFYCEGKSEIKIFAWLCK